jgi:hypothetical protein
VVQRRDLHSGWTALCITVGDQSNIVTLMGDKTINETLVLLHGILAHALPAQAQGSLKVKVFEHLGARPCH